MSMFNSYRDYFPRLQTPPAQAQRTALTDFGAFLQGLNDEEKQNLLNSRDFTEQYSLLLQSFQLFLLTGEAGAQFCASSDGAAMQAEKVLASAKNAHMENKKSVNDEVASLRKELAETKALLMKKGVKTDA